MTRRLVITADDLGRDPDRNVEIAALAADGLITATTLIAVSPHAAEAIELIRPSGLAPHLHVTLTSDAEPAPWHPLAPNVPTLTEADGTLSVDPFALGARGEEHDVLAECGAQLAWVREHDVHPSIADSHMGTLYGLHGRSWLGAALQWCAGNALAFRLPRDPTLWAGGALPAEQASALQQAVALADTLGVRLPQAIATNRRSAADLGSYEALRETYLGSLRALPDGTSEIFLHPGRTGAQSGADGILRVWEARLLRDPLWRSTIDEQGIELVASW